MKKLITEMLVSFPTMNLDIERANEITNEIGEKTKTWSNLYSNIKCIFSLRNQSGSENEGGGKLNINAKFTARFDVSDIGDDITNITVNDRAIVSGASYKIGFVHYMANDHVILFLNESD